MKDLLPRIVFGSLYIGLIVFATTSGPWIFAGLMALLFLLCFIEFISITELTDKIYIALAFLGSAGVFYFFSDYLFQQQTAFVPESLSFAGPILFILACYTILFSSNELYIEFGKATISVIYLAVPFSLALTIPQTEYVLGKEVITHEILFIFILIWVSDIMAYVIGSLWGKHKLAPRISGGKSWEGAIGGFVFTVFAGYLLEYFIVTETKINWWIIGLIVGIAAPIGDLVESKLKRMFNAKDSGKLIPGHGGFLDRLDSFIFVIPIVYLYLLISNIL